MKSSVRGELFKAFDDMRRLLDVLFLLLEGVHCELLVQHTYVVGVLLFLLVRELLLLFQALLSTSRTLNARIWTLVVDI